MRKWLSGLLALGLIGAVLALFTLYPPVTLLDPGEYEETTVTITDENGATLATANVRVAETRDQKRVGLSRVDSLANGTGMLFVHSSSGSRSYHMRNVSVGLDIVFIDSDGTITEIADAPHPDIGGTGPYRGTGQYVLEVPRGWMDTIGASAGDAVEIPQELRSEA